MTELICTRCGAIDDYYVRKSELHTTAYCNCGAYIKHLPNDNYKELTMYLGKYKSWKIKHINDVQYLEWALKNIDFKNKYIVAIKEQISDLKAQLR